MALLPTTPLKIWLYTALLLMTVCGAAISSPEEVQLCPKNVSEKNISESTIPIANNRIAPDWQSNILAITKTLPSCPALARSKSKLISTYPSTYRAYATFTRTDDNASCDQAAKQELSK